MKTEKINILYVDDEENNLSSLKAAFRREFNVFTAISAQEGREILSANEIQIIISDQRMPDETGVEFLKSIIESHPQAIRILLTGFADMQAIVSAINEAQIFQYITKPWDENQLRMIINRAFEIHSLKKENGILLEKLIKANKQLEFLLRQSLLS